VDATLAWLGIATLLVGIGLAGTLVPALPGVPLIFVGLALAAWAEGFAHVGGGTVALLAFLMLLAWAADFAAGLLGARRFGASRLALLGAGAGALIGMFLGLPGLILGPFAGAVLGELVERRDLLQAGRAGIGALLGFALGSAVKLAIGLSMLLIFAAARFLW
jgi:uncharacterized protein YqgC (DUF456 family)